MGAIDDPEKDQTTSSEEENEANWLDELGSEPTNLLKEERNVEDESGLLDRLEDRPPEWLEGELAQDMPEEDSVPDWLRGEISAGIAETAAEVEKETGDEDIETTAIYDRAPTIPEENVPDWLRDQQSLERSAGSEAAEADDLSWLDQIAAGSGAAIDEPPTLSWDEGDVESANQEGSAGEEDMTWLDDMGTLPGVMPAELAPKMQEAQVNEVILAEEAIQEVEGDLASELDSIDIDEGLESASGELLKSQVEPAEQLDGTVEEVPEDPDEAMAWLEQLAARQGAREEELPTLSEDTAPTPALDTSEIPEDPDEAMAWLEKMAAEQDAQDQELLEDYSEDSLPSVGMAEEIAANTLPGDDLDMAPSGLEEVEMPGDFDEALSWLEDMVAEPEPKPKREEVPLDIEIPVDENAIDSPSLADAEPALDDSEVGLGLGVAPSLEGAGPEDVELGEESEDAMAWLEQLAARQGADIEELTIVDSEEAEAEAPEWLRRELDEALDEAVDEEGIDLGAAGYSVEKLLEAEELDTATFEIETEPADDLQEFGQLPESESVDEVVKDLEEAEDLIADAELLEDVAVELESEAEELKAESEVLGAEAALFTAVDDDLIEDIELEDPSAIILEDEAAEFEAADKEVQTEAIELEVEAIIFEEEAEELDARAAALKLEAEAIMTDAEELISEIEEREAESFAEISLVAESDLVDMFGEPEPITAEFSESESEFDESEPQPQAEDELGWLETLGTVDADSWIKAEAEASSPELIVSEPVTDLDSASAGVAEIDREANILFGDAESVLDSEYLKSARLALENGEVDSALEAYNHLLDQSEGLPYLIAELEYSIDSYGQQPLLQRLLGDTYVRNGQLKKAVEVYRQALDNI